MRAAVLLALLAASVAQAAAPVTIAVRSEACVRGERITLADVAEMTGEASQMARLGAIDLGAAPPAGAARDVARQFLQFRLDQERVDPNSVEWAGQAQTRVTRAANLLPGTAIAKAAVDQIRKTLPWPDEDLVVEVTRAPNDLALLGSTDDLAYTVSAPAGQRFLGAVPVSVTIRRGDEAVGRASVLLEVRVFQRLVVAQRRIAPGERLTGDLLRLQRTEMTTATTDAIPDLAQVVGQEARQDIPAFAIVTRRMLGAPRIVRRGAVVTLLAEAPRMRITARGIAEQDGAAGQFISVRNVDSEKTVIGRILDAQRVQVPF
jgi:flagella basal body P-ring formation protein FlgA